MSSQPVNPWVSVAVTTIPEVFGLVKAILELKKAYPAMTPEQIQSIVVSVTTQADATFDTVLAKIAADAAAHPSKL